MHSILHSFFVTVTFDYFILFSLILIFYLLTFPQTIVSSIIIGKELGNFKLESSRKVFPAWTRLQATTIEILWDRYKLIQLHHEREEKTD